MTSLFVGNLNWDATADDLRAFFEGFGKINSVKIMTDRETGKPRGFGFIEMENSADAQKAIQGVNGREFMGRELTVNEARPREPRSNQGGNGGYGRREDRGGGGNRW